MDTNSITLPILGEVTISPTNIEGWEYRHQAYLRGYDCKGSPLDVAVHFKTPDEAAIADVSRALGELDKLVAIGAVGYLDDYRNGGEAAYYIEEWSGDIFTQIFTDEEFQAFLSSTDPALPLDERLLSMLRPVGVSVYAGSEDSFVVLDYAFGYDGGFRDDMLVVKLNGQYNVTMVTTEG